KKGLATPPDPPLKKFRVSISITQPPPYQLKNFKPDSVVVATTSLPVALCIARDDDEK
ncbi:Hypothetical predicted protein, partial [Olea europaea subsp. europaea]